MTGHYPLHSDHQRVPTMDQQQFQRAIAELQLLAIEIDLRLPTTRHVLVQQVKQLTTARYKLIRLNRRLQSSIAQLPPSPLQTRCLRLAQVAQELIRKADSLTMVAEEFATDPEGAIACCRTINGRKVQLLQQFSRQMLSAVH